MEKSKFRAIILLVTYTLLLTFVLFRFDKISTVFSVTVTVLLPFIFGGCLAFILNVPMTALEKLMFSKTKNKFAKKVSRPVSILVTLVLVISVISLVILVVVPEIVNTVALIISSLKTFPDKALQFLDKYNIDVPKIEEYLKDMEVDWEKVVGNVFDVAKNGIGTVFDSTFGIITSVFSATTSGLIGFIFSIYILAQKEKLGNQAKRVLYAFVPEKKADYVMKVAGLSKVTFSHFITGQCIEAVILGTMFFITLSILKFEYAVLIGVVIAVTALVPIFGAFIGCAIGVFLLFVVNPIQALWFIVVFLILQQLENNLIYPYVVGGSVGLPSIWVLAAVSVGGSLFGVMGMIFFIPATSVAYSLFREKVCEIERKKAQKVKSDIEDTDKEKSVFSLKDILLESEPETEKIVMKQSTNKTKNKASGKKKRK